MLLLTIPEFFHHLFHDPSRFMEPEQIIRYGGLAILFLIVYGQTGLFFCFFFPGDALIFSSGVLFASGHFHHPLPVILLTLITAAFFGNITGYWFGRKTGPALLKKKDSLFFKQQYRDSAKQFFNRYKGLAVTGGMFLPIIRTFSPIVAGMIQLEFKKFLFYALLGSVAWIGSLVSLGYFLGSFHWVRTNLHYIVLTMVIVITTPVLLHLFREVRTVGSRKASDR